MLVEGAVIKQLIKLHVLNICCLLFANYMPLNLKNKIIKNCFKKRKTFSVASQYPRTKAKVRRCGFNPLVGKIPWRRKWQPIPVFLPGKSHGQRSLAGYSPWDHKESDVTKRLSVHNKGGNSNSNNETATFS